MRFLFRPIRTIVLIGAAFLGGVVYEKSSHADRCLNAGGNVKTGLCEGARPLASMFALEPLQAHLASVVKSASRVLQPTPKTLRTIRPSSPRMERAASMLQLPAKSTMVFQHASAVYPPKKRPMPCVEHNSMRTAANCLPCQTTSFITQTS